MAAALGSTVPAGAADARAAAGEVRVERDVVWRTVDGESLTLDAYLPARTTKHRPAIVLVHGGGWRAGDKTVLSDQAQRLAVLGYVTFSIDYRLAPAHLYPAAVDDVQAAVRWLRDAKQVKHYGIDPDRIGALGGSAGAHLVAMLGTLGHGRLDRGARVRAVVEWSGPMDFTKRGGLDPASLKPGELATIAAVAVTTFLGCRPSACPEKAAEASPVTHVDKTDAPMLVVNSTNELVPESQAEAIAAALDKAGVAYQKVIVPGSKHANALTDDVWDQSVAFFERYLGKPKP